MNWYNGSIPDAVSEAKRNNKLFLVYIEGNDDMSKQMTDTYNDPNISKRLSSENVIALKLVSNSVPYKQFCAIYPVLVIPSSFFIGGNGAPIEIITGSLPPSEFSVKIEKLLEVYENSTEVKKHTTPENSPSTSSQETPVASQSEPSSSEPSTSQSDSAEGYNQSQTLEEKLERAKAIVAAQRQNKAMEEQEKERKQEIERRNVGKAMQQAQQSKQDLEMKEWAKNRAREKEEERLARERVKEMIAQDRAERAAKYQQTKEAEQAERERLTRNREETERAMRNAAMTSNDARIQFRLPDGSFTNHCFSADASLEEARRFIREEVRPPFSNFTLCTTFPRRHFTESNYSESLRDLQLAPSAVLLILPASLSVTNFGPGGGFFLNFVWMILQPFRSMWRYIRSFLPGNSPDPIPTPQDPSVPQPPNRTPKPNQSGENKPPNPARREAPFAKREGNVFRINNQSDDDENNTWNGNSTQQM